MNLMYEESSQPFVIRYVVGQREEKEVPFFLGQRFRGQGCSSYHIAYGGSNK